MLAEFFSGLVNYLTTSRRCGERRRESMASRSYRDRRLPNAIAWYSEVIPQRRFPDPSLILEPDRFLAPRSRAECPAVPPLYPPTAGGPDANAFPGRLNERGFHCYLTLTASVAPPVGLWERVRWAAPPPLQSRWRRPPQPAPGMGKYCLMRERQAPTKQSGRIVDSEWHCAGESCAEDIGHTRTRNAPSVSVMWIHPKSALTYVSFAVPRMWIKQSLSAVPSTSFRRCAPGQGAPVLQSASARKSVRSRTGHGRLRCRPTHSR
jgi:hypothetical protein